VEGCSTPSYNTPPIVFKSSDSCYYNLRRLAAS